MGIKKNDEIVIYDNSDVISSCRCWFNFIYFGHEPSLVHVLNGGLKKWVKENKKLTNEISNIQLTNYKSLEKKELVKKEINQIRNNLEEILDKDRVLENFEDIFNDQK